MNFLWQEALWLLLLLPLLVWAYRWLLNRRKKTAVAWSSLAVVKEAMGRQRLWRRHVPPALLLLALASLIVAGARPTAVITLPLVEQTVILAMDVSGSMRATDVEPNRLVASQNAAKAFIAELPRSVVSSLKDIGVLRGRSRRRAAGGGAARASHTGGPRDPRSWRRDAVAAHDTCAAHGAFGGTTGARPRAAVPGPPAPGSVSS